VSSDVPDGESGCLTLRDVAASDVVHVDGSTLYYVDEASGLWLVDVSDPDHPRVASHVPYVGTPRYLFVRDGIAWVVFIDWDGRWLPDSSGATIVRVLDVSDPTSPILLGDRARDGVVRDAELVGGRLYLLEDAARETVVDAFGLERGALTALGRTRLRGHGVELAASSAGLAAITAESDSVGVAWLDLPAERPGAVEFRGQAWVEGALPLHIAESTRLAMADDGQTVHVVTCVPGICGAHDGSRLHVIDFESGIPRVHASTPLTETGGLPLVRFDEDRLFVVTPSTKGAAGSELRAVALYPSPAVAGRVRLPGLSTSLAVRGDALVVLGRTSGADGRGRLLVHDVDVRTVNAPRLRGTVSFGSDWTWSIAESADAALSFDPSMHLAAIPFTTLREGDDGFGVGTQVVSFTARGPKLGPVLAADDWIERAIFVGGRLLAIGPSGIDTIEYAHESPAPREDRTRR
jgi:hypothetical protein